MPRGDPIVRKTSFIVTQRRQRHPNDVYFDRQNLIVMFLTLAMAIVLQIALLFYLNML